MANEHPTNRRGMLQPTGQIHRITHGRNFACRPNSPQKHRPGVKTDAHGQGNAMGGAESVDGRLHGQRGPHGSLRVVLTDRLGSP